MMSNRVRKTYRRLLSMVLCIAMVFTLFPAGAFAEESSELVDTGFEQDFEIGSLESQDSDIPSSVEISEAEAPDEFMAEGSE